MPEMKITRRIVDPITFVERVGIEFIPRIEDSVLDDQLAGSMSYAAPKSLPRPAPPDRPASPPPPPASAENARPPTPPKKRDKDTNQPRAVPSPAGQQRKRGSGLGSFISPRTRGRKSLTLQEIGEDQEMSESSMSNMSALQASLPFYEPKQEEKVKIVKNLRFADEVELNEISRLRNSCIAEMFWASEDLANFRYEAFMEEAGLDINEYD